MASLICSYKLIPRRRDPKVVLGIGLTLAKNLIELHGGSITASSRDWVKAASLRCASVAKPAVEATVPTSANFGDTTQPADRCRCQISWLMTIAMQPQPRHVTQDTWTPSQRSA